MSRGKRYDTEPKLNMKKVFAVIIAIAVLIMFIFMIKKLITKGNEEVKITSKSYFTVFKDNKWGVIDSNGNNVIDPSYKEMIVVPNAKVGVFICTYDVNYSTNEYKTKALNEQNQEIFTKYNKVEALQNIDKQKNITYNEDVLKVEKDGKYGLIKYDGKEVTEISFEEISTILETNEFLKVKKDGKYGILNTEGKLIVDVKYSDVDVLDIENKAGFIVKDENSKYGLVDYLNNQVLEIKYDGIKKVYGNQLYVVTVNSKDKIVNRQGEDVLTEGFDSVKEILTSQDNSIIFEKNKKYGVMSIDGKTIIDAQYDELNKAKAGLFIAKKKDKYGIIDNQNQEKLAFEYNSITYSSKADLYVTEDFNLNSNILDDELNVKVQGLLIELNESKGYLKIRVNEQYKYYNFKFEEKTEADIFPNRTLFVSCKDGKFGLIDKKGNVIVDYIYDDVMEQNDYGFVAVKKDGKWGSVNSKGSVVQEPTYNLDEYLLINFVGRWHLGQDVNMNYYCQL